MYECMERRNVEWLLKHLFFVVIRDVLNAMDWMLAEPRIKLGNRPLILVGHSMGGSLCVNVGLKLQERGDVNLAGLIVLDVVEGSAMLALGSMQFVLRNRPQMFSSMSEGIQWW
jgi:pimeloyl-ACP methyl ester carboxylesterase